MPDSPFISDFRELLTKHGIKHPKYCHGQNEFAGKVNYAGPVFDENEMVAGVRAFIEGKWSVAGEYCDKFERAFSKYLNQNESVFLNSGSSADLILIAATKKRFNWADGDKILVSPVTFSTTVSAITLNNLMPVFVDIEMDTLNFDVNEIEKILQQTSIKAIFVSPVLGNSCDLDKLTALSEKYNVKLCLDGCDSLGSKWKDKHLAEYFTVSSCSFYPAHHLTTGGQGGMISSNDKELIDIARSMITWGKSCKCFGISNLAPKGICGCRFSCWLKEEPEMIIDHRYIYDYAAYNLQPLEYQAAIGLAQMDKLESFHAKRKDNFTKLKEIFSKLSCVRTVESLPDSDTSWFGFPIIVDNYENKTRLVELLEKNFIQTRPYFAGNLLIHPGFKDLGDWKNYPNANKVLKTVFFVGVAPHIGLSHLTHIQKTVNSFVAT